MVKKTIILLVLYFFGSFTFLVRGEKNILPRSRSRLEPGVFDPLEPEPLEKNTRSRSRSRKKFCRLPSPALSITMPYFTMPYNIVLWLCVASTQQVSEIFKINQLKNLLMYNMEIICNISMPFNLHFKGIPEYHNI